MGNSPHNPIPFLKNRLQHEQAKLQNATDHENTEPIVKIIKETENAIAWCEMCIELIDDPLRYCEDNTL